jgi:UDP-N-acetylglucosamine/UDP-N-acetylgalactosamine 4-epimerase
MELKEKSILVTGGAGFIGSNIVKNLLLQGVKSIRILDNLSTGSYTNIDGLLATYKNLEYMWGDITNIDTCRKACKGIDLICHQAALGSVPRSIENPLNSHLSNVNGFVNILVAALENGIKRVVYASSSSVYGTDTSSIKTESTIGDAMSPYAVTKCVDELYAKIFTKTYKMECIGLRYFNIFGPNQNPNGAYAAVIPKFIKTIINDQPPVINGDGSCSRDFTYVDNAVLANLLALSTINSKCFGEAFNVGTNGTITVTKLYETLRDAIGKPENRAIYGPPRSGDIPYSRASIDKITELLNYHPIVGFEDGIRQTVDYFINL